MPLKAVSTVNALVIVIILGPSGTQGNTNMAELSEQLIKQYRKIITQFIDN